MTERLSHPKWRRVLLRNSVGTWGWKPNDLRLVSMMCGHEHGFSTFSALTQAARLAKEADEYVPELHHTHLATLWAMDPVHAAPYVAAAHARWVAVARMHASRRVTTFSLPPESVELWRARLVDGAQAVLASHPPPAPVVIATDTVPKLQALAIWATEASDPEPDATRVGPGPMYTRAELWRLRLHVGSGLLAT